jgi:antitoxin YefM
MRLVSISELRKTLSQSLDRVTADREAVIITRDRGKPAAVLLSLEEFASFKETQHLLRSPANFRRLRESIAELEAGGGIERTTSE